MHHDELAFEFDRMTKFVGLEIPEELLANPEDRVERRWRKVLFVVDMLRKARFDGLPADQQKAIRDAAADMQIDWRQSVAEATTKARAVMLAAGVQIVAADVEAYAKATRPIYDKFRPTIGDDLVDAILKQTGA